MIHYGDGMVRGYLNLLGKGMRFNFSSPLDMGWIMDKYIGVRDGDEDGGR